jgi:hypothetical protein
MDGSQAIASFAFAAIPGVLVLEIFEFGKPRLRERPASRALALYLIVSAAVWACAVLVLGADSNLIDIFDPDSSGGATRVAAYEALAWKLAAMSIGLGVAGWSSVWIAERSAHRVEQLRRGGRPSVGGKLGDALIGLVAFSSAWDAMVIRLRRESRAQVVQVRLRDGSAVYGILASDGRADFQADGRGIVLDRELRVAAGGLMEVPGSNGIFIAPEAVTTVAFFDYEVVDRGVRMDPE